MSTITTRAGKGSPLTNTEMDNNLTNLNTDKLQSGDTAASLTITSADINGGTIDGTTIGATTSTTGRFTTVESTATTGTAPFIVASTTNVVNLNASSLSGATFASPGPIGSTTASTAAFTETVITASGSTAALRVTNTGTGNSLLIEDSSNPDSSPFVIDAAGLVGIGTTAPATKLTINANTALPSAGAITGTNLWLVGADSTANQLTLDAFGAGAIGIVGRRANGTSASPTALSAGSLILQISARAYGTTGYSATSKAAINFVTAEAWTDTAQGTYTTFTTTQIGTTTQTERMRIDDAGNVGIGGTAASTFKLDVIGNSSSNAVQLRAINNDTSGTSASSLVAQNGSGTVVQLQTYGTDAILNVSSNNPLAFRTNNTERMRIDTSGVVTIAGDLAVNGSTSADITTTTTTASLFNATATTVNIGSAATTISIGDTLHSGTTTIQHDLYVHGNITFGAGASTLSATTISIDDTLISLADANTADILDIGFYAGYQPASTALHTGLVRDASDSVWKLFSGISAQPTTTVDFTGATYDPLRIGALTATDGTFSGVITASAGTNSAPAITTTGDINTGIFFPAADTIAFTEGGNEAMRINSSGQVGIGTTDPATKLTISNNTVLPSAGAIAGTNLWQVGADAANNFILVDAFAGIPSISGRRSSGTAASPTAIGSGQFLMSLGCFGYGATGYSSASRATMNLAASESWSDSAQGTHITFSTTANTTTTTAERMRIDNAGNVGIGSTPPVSNPFRLELSSVALGTTAGNQSLAQRFISSSGNTDILEITNTRSSAGSSWTTAGYRLQQKIDTTWMGWMQFNNGDGVAANNSGISWGVGGSTTSAISVPEKMRLDTNGNLGIGTTNPVGKLEVAAATDKNLNIDAGGVGSSLRLSAINDAANANVDLTVQASNTVFSQAGTERMRISAAGGVFVGSAGTDPGVGNLQVSGAVVSTRVNPRSLAVANTTGNVTPNSDLYDQVNYALTGTVAFLAPSGTPVNGQKLSIRLAAVSTQTVSWTITSTGYRIIGTILPTSVAAGKTVYVGAIWNSTDSFWDVVAVSTQA